MLCDEKQELTEHKLVNIKIRIGLWKVTSEVFENFWTAKQKFQKHTETWLKKIDGQLITKTLVPLANFSKLKNNINWADNEIKKNVWEDLVHLYIKIKTFSLFRSKMNPTRHCFGKPKLGQLEQQSNYQAILQQGPETSLEEFKNKYFDT